jgi:lipoprotein signal peptidase
MIKRTSEQTIFKAWLFPFLTFSVALGADIYVKNLVLEHKGVLPLFVASFFGKIDLWIDLIYNKGAAWGSFSEYADQLFILRCLILLFVCVLFYRSTDIFRRVAFALVMAGALGNLFDTIAHGKVIDMVHFIFFGKSFGIFNLADTSIFSGLLLLVFSKKSAEI